MLTFGRLALVLTGQGTGVSHFELGPMWRGALGGVLHESVCNQAPRTPCRSCSQLYACAYGSLYESQAPPDLHMLASGVPAPIALYVSEHRQSAAQLPANHVITVVEYSALNHALPTLPAIVQATQRLISRAQGLGPKQSRLQLSQVIWEPRPGDSSSRQTINPNVPMYFTPPLPATPPPAPRQIKLQSLVPLRINHEGRALRTLTPQDFMRRLLRRMQLMRRIYQNPMPDTDFGPDSDSITGAELQTLIEQIIPIASDWQYLTQHRYSSRQKRQVPARWLTRLDALRATEIRPSAVALAVDWAVFACGTRQHAGVWQVLGGGGWLLKH